MKTKTFKAIAAILLSALMLSTSLTAAFAAGTESVQSYTDWRSFPEQRRYSYSTGYTYAIQIVLYYADGEVYREFMGTIDGKFGPKLQTAVRMFQQKNGIDMPVGEEGVVDSQTWAKLESKLVRLTDAPEFPPDPGTNPLIVLYYGIGKITKYLFSSSSYGQWSVNIDTSDDGINWKKVN